MSVNVKFNIYVKPPNPITSFFIVNPLQYSGKTIKKNCDCPNNYGPNCSRVLSNHFTITSKICTAHSADIAQSMLLNKHTGKKILIIAAEPISQQKQCSIHIQMDCSCGISSPVVYRSWLSSNTLRVQHATKCIEKVRPNRI